LSFGGEEDNATWGRGSRGAPAGDLDITPMIDVTFLLLIFFMVTSTMSSQRQVDVPPARHGVNVDRSAAILIVVRSPRTSGGDPAIELNGEAASIDEVAEFVRDENAKGKTNVVVRAGREVPHGFVQRIIREANLTEELEFSFGVEDKHGS
jgi:biopolymer transport protein ExbD